MKKTAEEGESGGEDKIRLSVRAREQYILSHHPQRETSEIDVG